MNNSLEERLKTHSTAFDGLLSLIPAKYYYDESTQDQWQQKKKSKQELKQNKRSKLDPSSTDFEENMTAKEVMDVKAKSAQPVRLPKPFVPPVQQQEQDDSDVEIPDMDVEIAGTASDSDGQSEMADFNSVPDVEDSIHIVFDDQGNEVDELAQEAIATTAKNQADQKKKKQLTEEEKKQKQENLKKLREKLASKIVNLRERRKAPGTKTGGQLKSREQILEERKKKAELKKSLKRKHEEVEESSESENESEYEPEDNQVVFGNITFNDGTRVTSDLNKIRATADKKKGKGPSNNDIKAHLQKLERKKSKLASLTPEQQAKELEKEKWQRVMSQAEGVKVKDDEKLLKKALKRKEKQKLKSEIEWQERKRFVKDTIAAKIKKRDENLRLRRENRGKKSKQQVRLKKFTGIANKTGGKNAGNAKKKRAGFEGSAKSKGKSNNNNKK
ncbi:hypothetical protein PSN45_002025 [Yamadazyma tenuis]|uniref:uncharacterized protein n=1 Tax=Candida tenuis TaxID=2315449 RepID=UPI0027A29705|nr:hypothetical protein PSN45_002025 [Yamadazyma tenuis]